MAKKAKRIKSTLTQEDRNLGKNRIYILMGMIIIGLAVAAYNMQ